MASYGGEILFMSPEAKMLKLREYGTEQTNLIRAYVCPNKTILVLPSNVMEMSLTSRKILWGFAKLSVKHLRQPLLSCSDQSVCVFAYLKIVGNTLNAVLASLEATAAKEEMTSKDLKGQ